MYSLCYLVVLQDSSYSDGANAITCTMDKAISTSDCDLTNL